MTTDQKSGRICRLTARAEGKGKAASDKPRTKLFKKSQKDFKKGIDKAEKMWYNIKVGTRKAAD